MTPIIVFSLSVHVCSLLLVEGCKYEHVEDFISEAACQRAGGVMAAYPQVRAWKCVIDTREYSVRAGVGNPY